MKLVVLRTTLGGLLVALFCTCVGQTKVTLHAATARVGSAVEVRLRWRFTEGWIPAGGLKLYRKVGNNRQLVKTIPTPTDQAIDALLDPKFHGRKLATLSGPSLPSGNPIDLDTPFPPSRSSEFTRLKNALDGLKRIDKPVLPAPERNQRMQLLGEVKSVLGKTALSRPGVPDLPGGRPGGGGVPQLGGRPGGVGGTSAPSAAQIASSAKAARLELHLAAAIDNRNAETIGLGATDKGVVLGSKVGYVLHGVSASGQESAQPLASIENYAVGSDSPPAAPTGAVFCQNGNQILLRWARPSAAAERAALNFSYKITRATARLAQPRVLTRKPLVLMNLGGQEPISFFTDTVDAPGDYVYRVSMVDGFDREGAAAVIAVDADDWRRPLRPSRAGSSLGKAHIMSQRGVSSGKRVITRTQRRQIRLEPTVAWTPGVLVEGLPVKFNIFRSDLDQPSATPAKITQTPIDGTVMSASSDDELEAGVAMILGANFREVHEANVASILAREAKSAAEERDRARDAALAEARFDVQIKVLRSLVQNGKVRLFVDPTAQKDHRYLYLVSAIHPSSGLESDAAQAGQLDFPDFAAPPPVVGIQKKSFNLAPKGVPTFKLAPTFATRKPMASGAITQRIQSAKQKASSKSPLFVQKKPVPLALTPPDYGGTVELTWNGLNNLKDVRYQVLRRPSEPFRRKLSKVKAPAATSEFVEVGITEPNQASFQDKVPRTRARVYDYQVVAISRWGVVGAEAVLLRVQVPTMLQPEAPNALSAAPGDADGEIIVTVQQAPDAQDVLQYVLIRDGQQVQTKPDTQASDGLIKFSDPNRQPGAVHSYTVIAETAAPVLRSSPSRAVKGTAVKRSVSKPTSLSAQATANGVVLSWAAAAQTTYVVRRRPSETRPATLLSSKVATGSFTDVFALSGNTYFYEVAAVDLAGNVSEYAKVTITVP